MRRGVAIRVRGVASLLVRYDELLSHPTRLRWIAAEAGRDILAIDGLQPDVGHEVFWVLRDCLSGEALLARSLLSSTQEDLARLITDVEEALEAPIVGVISDGRHSIRNAVARALPGVAHQLCHFDSLREAAQPIFEADRHAKNWCSRNDSKRWCEVSTASRKRGLPVELTRLRKLVAGGMTATQSQWDSVAAADKWVFRSAAILANMAGLPGPVVRASFRGLLGAMARHGEAVRSGPLRGAIGRFAKVTWSYCDPRCGCPRRWRHDCEEK